MHFFLFFTLLVGVLRFRRALKRDARARCVGRGDRRAWISFSLSIARAGARGPTRTHTPLFHRQKRRKTWVEKKAKEREKERKKTERGRPRKREKKNYRGGEEEKKRALETRARVLIERKKARRSCRFPQKNIKFEDEIGMSASGIARSDQFERKDAFAR